MLGSLDGDDDRNWPTIAESVPGRDNKACRKVGSPFATQKSKYRSKELN